MKEVNLFLQTFPSNSPILYLDRFLLELSIDPKWLGAKITGLARLQEPAMSPLKV